MKFSWKHFNILLLVLILTANLIFNIWFQADLSKNQQSWGASISFSIFLYYFTPIAIVISSILILLLKSKYVKGNSKALSILCIILLYIAHIVYLKYFVE